MSKDPAHKLQLRDKLDQFVYGPAKKKLDAKLASIMESHSIDAPNRSLAFMFKGTIYAPENYRSPSKITLLTRRLYPYMDEWVAERNRLDDERIEASGYFTCMLNESSHLGDLMALLPDCLHPALSSGEQYQPPSSIDPARVQQLMNQHSHSIQKVKERLVLNLIF